MEATPAALHHACDRVEPNPRAASGRVSAVDRTDALPVQRTIGPTDFTREDAAALADDYGWTPLSAEEVPHHQRDDAADGRLTRWLRVHTPGSNGVVDYITLHWHDHGHWAGIACSERYQRGIDVGTDWMRTVKSVRERFGEIDESTPREAAYRRPACPRSETKLRALPSSAE